MSNAKKNRLSEISKQNLISVTLILAAIFSRLVPHPPNFNSVMAVAIFAGALYGLSIASFLLPFVALLITDLIYGFHSTQLFVYVSFAFAVVLGAFALNENSKGLKLFAISLVSSTVFFIITNFGVWFVESLYSHDIKGLVECYTMAIPFFKNQLAGDLFYSVILFYGYQFSISRAKQPSAKPRS